MSAFLWATIGLPELDLRSGGELLPNPSLQAGEAARRGWSC